MAKSERRTLAGGCHGVPLEPGIEQVFAALVPHYLNYKCIKVLDKASEHSARMVAMKNARTRQQLIKDLTLDTTNCANP